jgi:hypothetical protein
MRTSTRISQAGWAFAIALVLGLSGCGGSSDESGSMAGQAHKKGAAHQKKADPGVRAPEDMVAAVSASKSGPPVELKFELRERPEAGQPLDVDIAVLPDAPAISRIYAKFQGGEGFSVVDGSELSDVEKPAMGSVIRHVVRVVPKQDGIFALSATVAVDAGNDSLTRTFSIPVIVGEGVPQPASKAEVADGQAAAGTVAKTH